MGQVQEVNKYGGLNMFELWNKILSELSKAEMELSTIPKTSKEPIWFRVSTDGNGIFVNPAIEHHPSSRLTMTRKLTYHEFLKIYPLYLKREKGEAVSKDAAKATVNQVYWYSIIKNYIGIFMIDK